MRRYTREPKGREVDDGDVFAINDQFNEKLFRIKVGRCELKRVQTRVEGAWFQLSALESNI